jgi:hypothetical protein
MNLEMTIECCILFIPLCPFHNTDTAVKQMCELGTPLAVIEIPKEYVAFIKLIFIRRWKVTFMQL